MLLLNKQVILNLFQDLPIVLFGFCIVVVVIPESRSPGSVVSEGNKNSKNRFPTTTFGNDSKEVSLLSSRKVFIRDLLSFLSLPFSLFIAEA